MHTCRIVLICALFVWACDGQGGSRRRGQRNRNPSRRGGTGGLPSNLQNAYNNAVSENSATSHDTSAADNSGTGGSPEPRTGGNPELHTGSREYPWVSRSPSTPAPNDVECYVEVITTHQRGGRCTQLGGSSRPYICQSGEHFEFTPSCQGLIERRNREQP